MQKTFYEIDRSTVPPSCLPADLDKSNLVNITCLGDSWQKYMDKSTGKVHDGAEYCAELNELRGYGRGV
ncbi:MAG: hypothetical protein ACXWT0_01885 [Methylobacter sp.]